MSERRGHWYLITGALIGLTVGILTSWGIAPIQYSASSPSSLRPDFKDEYRYMIAAAYASAGNLGRARARLALLDKDALQALADQSKRMLANNIAPSVVRNVSNLSAALEADTPPTETINTPLPEPSSTTGAALESTSTSAAVEKPTATDTIQNTDEAPTPEPVATDKATATPLPPSAPTDAPHALFTPTALSSASFNLIKTTTFCEPGLPGLLQITLTDSNGQPAPGIELVISWAGGEEHFFSGLKPELGNGYADFVMAPNIDYALSLSNSSTRVTNLKSTSCNIKDGGTSSGGIHLEFKQP